LLSLEIAGLALQRHRDHRHGFALLMGRE